MTQASVTKLKPLTERGRRTRQELLAAAEAVFAEKGYEAASVSEITTRAGVAQGTFYLYFPDKRHVFAELVDDLGRRLRWTIRQKLEGLTVRLEVERAGLRAFLDFCAEHRGLYRIVHQAEFVDPEAFRRYYARMAEGYADALRGAMSRKEIRKADPERLAYCLMGIADFLGMRYVLWEKGRVPASVIDDAVAFIGGALSPVTPLPSPSRPPSTRSAKR